MSTRSWTTALLILPALMLALIALPVVSAEEPQQLPKAGFLRLEILGQCPFAQHRKPQSLSQRRLLAHQTKHRLSEPFADPPQDLRRTEVMILGVRRTLLK